MTQQQIIDPTPKGKDYSTNQPALPVIGATPYGGTGLYSTFVLMKTVPANRQRKCIDIENLSGSQIVIVRDDGVATTTEAPQDATVFSLAGGSAPGAQGGSWSSTTFFGRIQIYGPTGNEFVAVMED